MGAMNGIKCTVCDYEEQFQFGEGALDYYESLFVWGNIYERLSYFSKSEQVRITADIKNALNQPDATIHLNNDKLNALYNKIYELEDEYQDNYRELEVYNTLENEIEAIEEEESCKYGWNLYYCRQCNKLHNFFNFTIYYRNGIYTPDYKCPICNNPIHLLHYNEIKICPERIDIIVENVTYQHMCPKCGAATCEDAAWQYGCFD
jgi:rubrerythrin